MKKLKVIHFSENCIGCNSCVLAAPNTWYMDNESGKAVLIDGVKKRNVSIASIPDFAVEENEKAAASCPMRIIKVE